MSLLVLVLLSAWSLEAQILNPAKWSFTTSHIQGDEYELVFNAKISNGWSIYSQYLESDMGPVPTSIQYDQGEHFEIIGQSEEDPTNKSEGYDPMFDMNLIKYKKTFKITQKVKVLDPSKPITGYLTFMVCDDSRCLPPDDVAFSLHVGGQVEAAVADQSPKSELNGSGVVETALYGLSEIKGSTAQNCDDSPAMASSSQSKTFIGIFILGMLGGFLALLTPCVFPLIPLTVSFFTKGSEDKKKGFSDAMLYGGFILAVYVLLSVPFHLLDSINPDILNEISTNVWLNLSFFVIFMFFAFSFFGYYEITLPSGLTNKVSSAEGVGGILGIFFMALTLSLVSFSCTGPILGSLLAGALTSDGGAWQLTAGMSGFGLALALPFAVFAMFPGWMNSIPKSGGWLNSVKVVLGFVELALAFKFLSNADLVMHWGILKYELFMVLWIVIAVGLTFYLFGWIRFKHDSAASKISKPRLALGIVAGVFSVYLIMGLTKNDETNTFSSLKLLSGLAPPAGYSWLMPNDCPNDINCFKDLESGLAYAKSQNKPVLLDFTGYACVNCRKMEEHVWSDAEVSKFIKDDYVLISLYVDDKKELPQGEHVEVARANGGQRTLTNYGHKWAHFQTKFFNTNSQPYYVLLSPDGKQMLNQPVGYTPDIGSYADFLKCGLMSFENLKKVASHDK